VENTSFAKKTSTLGAFSHAFNRASVIVPTFGVMGAVCPSTDAGESRAWSPPV
jgi:hypothetical protein